MQFLVILAIFVACLIVAVIGILTIFQTDDSSDLIEVKNTGSIFKVFVSKSDFNKISNNRSSEVSSMRFELNSKNNAIYEQIKYNSTQNAIVVFPIFTASAYSENGFYSYYNQECDESCLTVPLSSNWDFSSSAAAIQTLHLLGYPSTDDYILSKNPEQLVQYDTVILLHNEYVTESEFNAITNHPNVVHLYPNSLYAKVNLNSEDTITLIRGHGYPTSDILNGFNWEFENTPLEYDLDCGNLEFYKIDNGVMLNCYPENGIDVSPYLLKLLKEF